VKKIVYICDYFIKHVLGGAEINDDVLINEILKPTFDTRQVQSNVVNLEFLREEVDSLFIIGNFINLSKNCKEYLQNNCKYIIYEHDHKYLISRNPVLFENYKAPPKEIINIDFYANALRIIAQSNFHKKIIEKNLNIENVFSIGGNLWPESILKEIKLMNKNTKISSIAILNSSIPHKNTAEAVRYCEAKDLNYTLIKDRNYKEFLKKLNSCSTFLFLPKTPETLSRVVVEARMLGLKTITSKNIGALYEPWFKLKGDDLVEAMEKKKRKAYNLINEQ
tara:strand:+ start:276 stop:1112 length:837 start_codon:yes stop_codon:yes gene_type:complete